MEKMKRINILFTGVGRRVELLQAFRNAALVLNKDLKIYGADMTGIAPALAYCDYTRKVVAMKDEKYIDNLLSASYSGTDLKYYAKHVKHTGTVNGYRVYYTSYRINGKETSYSNYKKQFKKITKNQKAITVQLKKNTKANRVKL